jgi:hypothetical protein
MSYAPKEHCHYCRKALYSMRMDMRQNQVIHIEDVEKAKNSDAQTICTDCRDRLIYRGSFISCSSCDRNIFMFKRDLFKHNALLFEDLLGVYPQHDPIERVINRCVHCKTIIEWGRHNAAE